MGDLTKFNIKDMNNGKRFDICLMNPPYGMGTDTIHLKFVDKCLDICDKQIVVMPFKFITKDHNCYKKYKESDIWNDELVNVEEVDSSIFKGTAMENVGIYLFDNNESKDIDIITINGKYDQKLNKIDEFKTTSNYDDEILRYLYNDHISNDIVWGGGFGRLNNKYYIKHGYNKEEAIDKTNNIIKQNCDKVKSLNKDIYLILSSVTGSTFFSKTSGLIFKNINDFKEYAIKQQFCKGFSVMGFDTIKEAENCKEAMKRPLLRFGLINAHHGLDIVIRKGYKYIPDIDWSDDRVKTDEGLLEVCGCPKDKCKEYVEYCKKIIDEVDKT